MALDFFMRGRAGRVLHSPLADNTLALASRPGTLDPSSRPDGLLGHTGDQEALDQGWAVVFPDTVKARAIRAALQPLVAWRSRGIAAAYAERRAGSPWLAEAPPCLQEWPVGPVDTPERFLSELWLPLEGEARPMYLALLGDFDELPLDWDLVLSRHAWVGRICLPEVDDYACYAEKLIRHESRQATVRSPRCVFVSTASPFGDHALDMGHQQLVLPLHRQLTDPLSRASLGRDRVTLMSGHTLPDGTLQDGLAESARLPEPTVLFSLGHGLGDPDFDAKAQRLHQGSLMLDEDEVLADDVVSNQPFVPGGIWFHYACYSAGTPRLSAYRPWLKRVGQGQASVAALLSTQARGPSFVARQPQLALANPDGPLAVVGHADIAFSYAFESLPMQLTSAGARRQGRHEVLGGVVNALTRGGRAGLALHSMRFFVQQADEALLSSWHRWEESSPLAGLPLSEGAARAELLHLGHNWMAHHDLRGWLVLGDPAARVTLSHHKPLVDAVSAPELAPLPVPRRALRAWGWRVVEQGEDPSAVARELGFTASALARWYAVWDEAGGAAVEAAIEGATWCRQ